MKQCTPIKPHKYDKLEYLCAVQHFNCDMQKIEIEGNVKYLNTITPLNEYDLLGGFDDDRVFVVRPRRIEDIDCINTINKYITDGTSILNYYNIGEIYVLIFGADSFDSDLENYEYLTIKTASEVIKYNTQKIMDIITIMSKEEIETEEN